MKKILSLTASIIFTVFLYVLYVLDNVFCAFGIGTKLPFKDFLGNFYARKLAYVRITVAVFVYFLWKLIF